MTVEPSGNAELGSLGLLAADIASETTRARVVVGMARRPGGLHLRLTPGDGGGESYRLKVRPDGVVVEAPDGAGLFYGLQTLRQLLESAASTANGGTLSVPTVTVVDAPRFTWRGLHLDVSRHFLPVAFVKRYIDLMARYKLNTFHWHLTDDQGWRIEIRKHPRLTTVGGCRRETMVERNFNPYLGDGTPHCGFYTQEEIRDVVAYASARYVTVVPEIEMPGHAKAALAAYPELACTAGPFEVRTTWGVDEDVFCPGEPTFAFIEDVLTEVIALFPGRYIHIGGDEVPKTRWKQSPLAQEIIRREGLKDEHELQSWFIRRVGAFLVRNHRRLVGWDEILDGGLAPSATVMSWRGTAGGVDAARQGRDVVMTPNSSLYFDYYQGEARFEPLAIGGFLPLEHVYAYEPIPDSLTRVEARRILGAQANVWTEYLKTPSAVEFMAFPRTLALAEVVWSPREARNWRGFTARLPAALRSLDRLGVSYRLPGVEGLEEDRVTLDESITVALRTPLPDAEIRYTTDGSDPTVTSTLYARAFQLPATLAGSHLTARAFLRDGRVSAPRAATFKRTSYRSADRPTGRVAPGVRYSYYEAALDTARSIDALTPVREGVVSVLSRRGDERPEGYGLRFTGYLRVPGDGIYTLALSSDDGSLLSIGDAVVVDNDGAHGMEEKAVTLALRAGYHPLTLRFFQAGGGVGLSMRVRRGDGAWQPVPPSWLAHSR